MGERERLTLHGQDNPAGKYSDQKVSNDESLQTSSENPQMKTDFEFLLEAHDELGHMASFPLLNPNPLLEVDSSGKVFFSNPATHNVLEALGMDSEEVDLFLPEDLEEILEDAEKRVEASISREVTIKDRVFCVNVSTSPGIRGAHIYCYDITESKWAQKALKTSVEKYRSLFESSHDGIVFTDMNGNLQHVNPAFQEIVGYSLGELRTMNCRDLTPALWHGLDERIVQEQVITRGYSEAYEKECIHKDGKVFPISLRVWLVRDESNNPLGMWGIVRDITKLKRTEQELQALNVELERRAVERTLDLTKANEQLLAEIDERRRAESIMQARLRLLERADTDSMDDLLRATLDEIEALTGSSIGFYHFLESDQKTLLLQNWSTNTLKNMGTAERKGRHYDIDEAGVWVDCVHERRPVIHNDSSSLPHKKGMPEGQAQLTREVVVPIVRGGLIRAIIGVGNKTADYDEIDVEILSRLGDLSLDIIERKRAEEEVRQSEEFMRSILDSVDEGFIVVGRDYRIISANKAYCLQTGLPLENVIGKYCFEVSHKAHTPCYEANQECAVRRVFETGKPGMAVHEHKDEEGNSLYVEIKAFPLKDASGIVTSAIETIHNITERYLLEEEQLKTQKLEAIGTLAGGIAHDFNNLLQGVFGYISMGRMTIDRPDEAVAMLDQAEKALTMSVNLTSQLLTFAKGGQPMKKKIALRPAVENGAKFALAGSRCDLRMSIARDLWHAEADEGQIGQVIQNIVLNASEAMAVGGTIEISADNVEIAPGDNPFLTGGGRFVRIMVRDTGNGIPERYLSKIFDPYFTTKKKGSGLGLATSYSIIKGHGGTIDVISEPNKGCTFTIYLPGIRPVKEESDLPSAAMERHARILVMDDEESVRNVARAMITALAHEAEFAKNGEEAIEKFVRARESGNPFDVVILDLTVKGGMGGEATIRRLRELEPHVKAIVSSGYADNPVVSNYEAHGFLSVLNKPYGVEALRDCLYKILSC